ncbi:hypothetical protein FEM48_Zijuj11G0152000 [Ziziphus jujuba var. spinosa]|uniref:7-deoxyloganetic acid glucosyltransferase-like n=1 Tax=Ziziphus jujuba var. spinosa TaxID=714518 RepID=A0A978UJP0_ZIZJJ|nr:hypothetical protein FEM48_Zijuj11G0152000 [Ziziphus jujuba var. spinosa]
MSPGSIIGIRPSGRSSAPHCIATMGPSEAISGLAMTQTSIPKLANVKAEWLTAATLSPLADIKPFLCLAQLLSQTSLYITFVNTRYNHKCFSNLSALSLQFPNLHFESISDGMPDEDDQPRPLIYDFFYGLKYQAKEHLKELIGTLSRRSENAQSPPITCIIGDGSVSFPVDVAEELGIPVISFCCHSAH